MPVSGLISSLRACDPHRMSEQNLPPVTLVLLLAAVGEKVCFLPMQLPVILIYLLTLIFYFELCSALLFCPVFYAVFPQAQRAT